MVSACVCVCVCVLVMILPGHFLQHWHVLPRTVMFLARAQGQDDLQGPPTHLANPRPSAYSSLFNSPLTSNMSHSRNDNDRNMPVGETHLFSQHTQSSAIAVFIFNGLFLSLSLSHSLCFSLSFFFPPPINEKVCGIHSLLPLFYCSVLRSLTSCSRLLGAVEWSAGERAGAVV